MDRNLKNYKKGKFSKGQYGNYRHTQSGNLANIIINIVKTFTDSNQSYYFASLTQPKIENISRNGKFRATHGVHKMDIKRAI